MDPESLATVKEGLMRVVNGAGGTGWRAKLSYTIVSGKTGTAQWGPEEKEQKLGWFAGFFPLDRPKYAFAMVYEGRPGEKVGGGSKAAPMVKSFFEPMKEEIEQTLNPAVRALIVVEEEPETPDGTAGAAVPNRATVVPEDQQGELFAPRAQLVDEAVNPYASGLHAPRALLAEEDPQPYIQQSGAARAVPVVEDVQAPDFGEVPRATIVDPNAEQFPTSPSRALIIEE